MVLELHGIVKDYLCNFKLIIKFLYSPNVSPSFVHWTRPCLLETSQGMTAEPPWATSLSWGFNRKNCCGVWQKIPKKKLFVLTIIGSHVKAISKGISDYFFVRIALCKTTSFPSFLLDKKCYCMYVRVGVWLLWVKSSSSNGKYENSIFPFARCHYLARGHSNLVLQV